MKPQLLSVLALFSCAAAASPVLAHVGDHGAGAPAFLAGLGHPVGGPDHLLAMIAVGLWAASLGGKAVWALPAAFLGAMVFGALAGLMGLGLPLVEPMILASSVVVGGILALALKPGLIAAVATTALFGLMHGHAHGTEAPEAGLALYGLGFMLATAALHGAGIALARPAYHRLLGAAAALGGLALALA